MKNKSADVIVIGAGAAGLMAAASASSRGLRVLLLEKNRKLGVKILISGGTRCNITHNCDSRGIVEAFGRQGRFLHSALAALPPEKVVSLIESRGVETKVEDTGKIFPASDSAVDVRDAIVGLAVEHGAEILNLNPVVSVELKDDVYQLTTGTGNVFGAPSLIITTGGRSYPGCGTTGDGYAWTEQFGHTIVNTVPALTPVTCNEPWANELKGITLPDTEIAVWDKSVLNPQVGGSTDVRRKKKAAPLDARRGSFLFTHFGFSGPAALNVSRAITRRESPAGLQLQLDFQPGQRHEAVADQIRSGCAANGKQTVSNLLAATFPSRLADTLIQNSGIDLKTKNAELSKAQLVRLVEAIKRTQLPVSGTLGFKKAEVTAGGVDLKEVDSRTMESKLQPRLFLAGEILDLDGPIGGFNFQSAFSTGWLAGQSVVKTSD
ncbi:MAG: NAD(P)/FAD-dependent oxidoreductase [Planctomycetota bacterium]